MHRKQLQYIHDFVRDIVPYKKDYALTGGDVWRGLKASIENGGGDCEDISLSEMEVAELGGMDPKAWSLVAGRTIKTWRNPSEGHAVLVVGMWVLDCRYSKIVRYDEYFPRYLNPFYTLKHDGIYFGDKWVSSLDTHDRWIQYNENN